MSEAHAPHPLSLLVFSDDWGRHPSSCQHLMRHLLDRYEVHWVNTIGTRTPRLDLATLRRGLEKLRHWSGSATQADALPPHLHVHSPKMWPGFGSRLGRFLNRRLLLRQLAPVVASCPEPPTIVTTIPLVADLIGSLRARRWVYYCVDDFGEWPGLDRATLREMEGLLIERADTIIAVSEVLRERIADRGREAELLTHGVDLEFWRQSNNGSAVPELKEIERPLVVFWGVLDGRMDTAFVRRLAADLRQGTVLLVGPTAEHDPALDQMERVRRLPPLRYEQLPSVARAAAVLIMPYADLPVTRAIQPLKLKEYLATGRPVVVRDLPATRPWANCLDVVDSPEAFSQIVQQRLTGELPESQRQARRRLDSEGWDAKAEDFSRWACPADVSSDPACDCKDTSAA